MNEYEGELNRFIDESRRNTRQHMIDSAREHGFELGIDDQGRVDYSRLSIEQLFRQITSHLFSLSSEERRQLHQMLQAKMQEPGAEQSLTEEDFMTARLSWIKSGAGLLSTVETRKEAREVLGMIRILQPAMMEFSDEGKLKERSLLDTYQARWESSSKYSFNGIEGRRNAQDALQFLSEQRGI